MNISLFAGFQYLCGETIIVPQQRGKSPGTDSLKTPRNIKVPAQSKTVCPLARHQDIEELIQVCLTCQRYQP